MKEIVLKYIDHRGKVWTGVFGPDEKEFGEIIRKCKGKWSRTWNCWLLEFTREAYDRLRLHVNHRYKIDDSALRIGAGAKKGEVSQKKTLCTNESPYLRPEWMKDQEGLALWEQRQQ